MYLSESQKILTFEHTQVFKINCPKMNIPHMVIYYLFTRFFWGGGVGFVKRAH